jgi:hypothetical protein
MRWYATANSLVLQTQGGTVAFYCALHEALLRKANIGIATSSSSILISLQHKQLSRSTSNECIGHNRDSALSLGMVVSEPEQGPRIDGAPASACTMQHIVHTTREECCW